MVKQVIKRVRKGIVLPPRRQSLVSEQENDTIQISEEVKTEEPLEKKENKSKKTKKDMTTEQFEQVETLVDYINAPKEIKKVKRDRGLIERTESSKIILTEDNRQVLND